MLVQGQKKGYRGPETLHSRWVAVSAHLGQHARCGFDVALGRKMVKLCKVRDVKLKQDPSLLTRRQKVLPAETITQ